ncbi:MAG: MarR family transcriptional regulator [Acidimicrobiia bacterium]
METHQTRDEYDVATAQAVVMLGGAGRILSEAIRSSSGLDVLNDNSAMVAFLLLWLSGPLRPGEIAEAMNITTGGSTKVVTKLEDSGIVSRLHNSDVDGRAVVVALTEKGERVASAVLVAVGETVRDLMARLQSLDSSAG